MKTTIQIIEFNTEKVVKEVDVTGRSNRSVNRIKAGMDINLNHFEYYTLIQKATS